MNLKAFWINIAAAMGAVIVMGAIIFGAALFFSRCAQAEPSQRDGWYAGGTFGATTFEPVKSDGLDTHFDDVSTGFTAEGGYCFYDSNWCVGLDLARYWANVDRGFPISERVREAQGGVWSLTGNAYYQVNFNDWFTVAPYGGVGFGFIGYDPTRYDGIKLHNFQRTGNLGDIGFQSQAGVLALIGITQRCSLRLHLIRYARTDFASRTGVDHESAQQVRYHGGGMSCAFGG